MALVVAILVAVIGSEQVSEARRRARGELSPMQRLDASASAAAAAARASGE
jgi:hypothetical protein